MKSETLIIRMDAELKAELKKLADSENRTMSNYVELLIKKELNK